MKSYPTDRRIRKRQTPLSCFMADPMTEKEEERKMKDCKFDIYDERYVHLFGEFRNGCLQLTSLIFGEDRDSEMIYDFSKADTEKLFFLVSLEDFKKICRAGHLLGMEKFLKDNGIRWSSFVY